jgi:hypothetical protein
MRRSDVRPTFCSPNEASATGAASTELEATRSDPTAARGKYIFFYRSERMVEERNARTRSSLLAPPVVDQSARSALSPGLAK